MKKNSSKLNSKKIVKSKKIKFLAISLLAITGFCLTLSGCGFKKPNNKNEININFLSHKMEQHDAFTKLAKKFKETHPKVNIKVESVGGETDYFTKLKSSFTSGKGPDIFNISSFAEMQEYKQKAKDISNMPLLKNMNGTLKDFDNKEYLIPECYEGFGYIVRKDIFEKAGVDVNTMKTFNGLQKGFEKLQKSIPMKDFSNLKAVLGVAGSEMWIFGNHMIIPALNKEFSSPQEAYKSTKFEFKGSKLYKDILDFQLKYSQKENLVSSNFQSVVDNGIFSGKYAATQQGTWLHTPIKEYEKKNNESLSKKLAFLPYSTPEDGENEGKFPAYVGQYFMINKDVTEEQYKAIKEFLEYLYTTEEGTKILTEELGFISPIKDAKQKFEEGSLNDTLLKAIKDKKTMSGGLSVIRTEEWGVKSLGASVQKYILNPTKNIWDENVVEKNKKTWEEIAKKQLKE